MGRFVDDADYTLDWPSTIFEDELRRLISLGREAGAGDKWYNEVETLLRQAFSSRVPLQDFQAVRQPPSTIGGYDSEPF